MRILVHDFAGHAFPMELSRALAAEGHEVAHVHCASFVAGHGRLERLPADPRSLEIVSIDLGTSFSRYSPLRRARHEATYARRFLAETARFRPDVVLDSNPCLLAKALIARGLRRQGVPWVYWLQDIVSVAMATELEARAGRAGTLLARLPRTLEARALRRADQVVAITPDFRPHLEAWGVGADRTSTIPNWGPVEEIVPGARDAGWLGRNGIDAAEVVLYAGTLGLKHNPQVLVDLAVALRERPGAALVVASEGTGADFLRERLEAHPNLHVLPYQPFEEFPAMLASADVTVAILNDAAGTFSVPSKVLAYLCAGRPVVAAVPAENHVARVLGDAGAGEVVPPDDGAALGAAVLALLADAERRAAMGSSGRAYAEAHFSIGRITAQLSAVMRRAAGVAA